MLCELCHKNDAGGVMHRKNADGDMEDIYVCKECLAAEGADSGEAKNAKCISVSAGGEEPPAFIRNFLDAAVGLIEGVTHSGDGKPEKCPVCGSTWEKIKSERTLGCPDCWSSFGDEIRREFLGSAYGPKHMGAIPETNPDGAPSRAFLEKELREAVARQHYRRAAELRRRIDELDGKGK